MSCVYCRTTLVGIRGGGGGGGGVSRVYTMLGLGSVSLTVYYVVCILPYDTRGYTGGDA